MRFRQYQAFVEEANRITKAEDLRNLVSDAAREMGFNYVAIVEHVNVGERKLALSIETYPDDWRDMVLERRYFSDDPVMALCNQTAMPFAWSEVPQLLTLTARQSEILASARHAGLGDGFTVPINVPGETQGSCNFGVRLGRALPEASRPIAHHLGCFAFEAMRRVHRHEGTAAELARSIDKPKLTQRQLDCVVLVARGKGDWEIGQLLGISDQTVHHHVEAAKRRYGVASRQQLVVRALFDSQITFTDALR